MFSENCFEISPIVFLDVFFGSRSCSCWHSCNSSLRSPSCHIFNLRSRAFRWSFDFEDFDGFCNKRLGMIITALNATSFKGESSTQAFNRRVISSMYFFPAFPEGNIKIFFLHMTIVSYATSSISVNDFLSNLPHVKNVSGGGSGFGKSLTSDLIVWIINATSSVILSDDGFFLHFFI